MHATTIPADRVDAFARAATAAGSEVHRVGTIAEAGALARDLAAGAPILVTPEVADDAVLRAALGDDVLVTAVAADAADRPLAVERVVLGVAETGSVLVREADRASRLASMLARTLVQVVEAGDLVDGLDDAGAWLAAHAHEGYAALVTGPSRTADIERVLTVGVQGPARLILVIVEPSIGDAGR